MASRGKKRREIRRDGARVAGGAATAGFGLVAHAPPASRGAETGRGPLILSGNGLERGRRIGVCSERVFRFTHRFEQSLDGGTEPSATRLYGQGG